MKTAQIGGIMFLAFLAACTSCNEESGIKGDYKRGLSSIEDSMNYILGGGIGKTYSGGNKSDINIDATQNAVWDFMDGEEFRFSREVGNELTARYLEIQNRKRNDSLIRTGEKFLEENAKRPEVIVLDRGLQYEVIKSGPEGGISPDGNDAVKLKYAQGNPFDGILWTQEMATNPAAKDTVSLALNRELSGVSQACQYMKIGDKWKVWLPYEIGSAEGRDPAGIAKRYEVIYIEMELLGVTERGLHNIPNTREFKGYPGLYYKDESKRIPYMGD